MRAPPAPIVRASLAISLLAAVAGAQSDRASAYSVNRWNTESGLPQNSVNAILQSRDGYLWLATLGGIARFDGTSFFTITTGDHAGLGSDRAHALAEDRDGAVWIGTEDGLSRLDHGRVTTLTMANGLPGGSINALAAAPDGAIWFGTGNGGVGRVLGGVVHVVVAPRTLFGNALEDLLIDPAGRVWVSARTGVWRIDPGDARANPIRMLPSDDTRRQIPRIVLDRESPDVVWAVASAGLVGVALAEAMSAREATSRIPLIFLSALVTPADVRRGVTAGDRPMLSKSSPVQDLLASIDRALGVS